jgi:hypothetical protein
MAVTVAAQTVQRSAAPDAYAAWEDEARALAVAFTGERPQGMDCTFGSFNGAAPTAAVLTAAATAELGSAPFGAAVPAKTGWQVALWAEAHAWAYHLASVTYAGSVWTPRSGVWTAARGGATGPGVALTYAGASS